MTAVFALILKNWKLLIIGSIALILFGLGFGFWSYIKGLNADLHRAKTEAAQYQARVAGLEQQASDDADRISGLVTRIDLETEMAQERLNTEIERNAAAELRNRNLAGAVNELRLALDESGCACGVGPDLSGRLYDSRTAREAARTAREGAD